MSERVLERMPPRLDDKSETDRLQLVVPRSWVARIAEWRRKQDPIPNVSAAIRRLVEIALDGEERRSRNLGPTLDDLISQMAIELRIENNDIDAAKTWLYETAAKRALATIKAAGFAVVPLQARAFSDGFVDVGLLALREGSAVQTGIEMKEAYEAMIAKADITARL